MWLAIGSDDPWAVILPLQLDGTPAQHVTARLRNRLPQGTLAIVGLVNTSDARTHAEALLSGFDVYVTTTAGPGALRTELERIFVVIHANREETLPGDF